MAPTKVDAPLSERPSKSRFPKRLGAGFFAKVAKRLGKESQRQCQETKEEISAQKKIKSLNLECIDSYESSSGEEFVCESLDISLREYMNRTNDAPMLLSDIRTIIQQMATALKALKENDLIHTDVTLENIMTVNHQQRPFEVKLIDFGSAIPKSSARKGMTCQSQPVRSPEVFLSNNISEAIDMWSLGCAMFQMICGSQPFSGDDEYEIVRGMVELLGPPDREFFRGQCTVVYFNSPDYLTWTIKTRHEYYGKYYTYETSASKSHQFESLDEMKEMRLEENNPTEAEEREQCIELLKAMLTLVGSQRITPAEVLTHPFITKGNLNVQPDVLNTSTSEDFEREPLAAPLKDEDIATIQPDGCTPSPEIPPSGAILVQSVTTENTTLLEDQESAVSEPPTAPLTDEDGINVQPDDNDTPSPEILPSGVILVRPATPENTTLLEDQESPISFQSVLSETSMSSVSDADDSANISEDSATCEETGTKKKGKKKKNWFRRILSSSSTHLRKKFSSRVSPINQ